MRGRQTLPDVGKPLHCIEIAEKGEKRRQQLTLTAGCESLSERIVV